MFYTFLCGFQSGFLLVSAIDFGTTYSGWAFSFTNEFKKDPTDVFAKVWNGQMGHSAKSK